MVESARVNGRGPVNELCKQSPPVDLDSPYDPSWVGGKTILITGGASGFGEGFFRRWASYGANVIIGDINDDKGRAVVAEVRESTKNWNHHYIHCDVTSWESQVEFYKQAVKLSPTGGIDAVVANAGIAEPRPTFETPVGLDADSPPKPNFKVTEIDLIGVMYTVHLAYFYLPRNPRSEKPDMDRTPAAYRPDRHILLIGSVASLMPLPGQVQYNISKHGVLGMFRALRSTAFTTGVRVNILCPYFIETPIVPAAGRVLLAGGAMGQPADVVEAATRLMADSRICGRGLAIGPRLKTSKDDEWELVPMSDPNGKEMAIWECYPDDFEQVDAFVGRFLTLLNTVEYTRGWAGWTWDIGKAIAYPIVSKFGLYTNRSVTGA